MWHEIESVRNHIVVNIDNRNVRNADKPAVETKESENASVKQTETHKLLRLAVFNEDLPTHARWVFSRVTFFSRHATYLIATLCVHNPH